uniref:Uncharacterized protein n=1 Tax=Entomoneis paludosa TaxID=265537 RepID=A0A7S2V784_9STRA|mmetsp:Transcript_10414/g.21412  ORF Transcript_10414/g.21412 Transcript_10414/m.21412 type:complete len:239 (+) Transcript_10414:352-1068(+)
MIPGRPSSSSKRHAVASSSPRVSVVVAAAPAPPSPVISAEERLFVRDSFYGLQDKGNKNVLDNNQLGFEQLNSTLSLILSPQRGASKALSSSSDMSESKISCETSRQDAQTTSVPSSFVPEVAAAPSASANGAVGQVAAGNATSSFTATSTSLNGHSNTQGTSTTFTTTSAPGSWQIPNRQSRVRSPSPATNSAPLKQSAQVGAAPPAPGPSNSAGFSFAMATSHKFQQHRSLAKFQH